MKWSKLKFKHIINPKRWFLFIQGKLLSRFVSLEYCEQVVYRSKQCPECVEQGFCDHCGCSIPEAMLTPGFKCSGGHFDKMVGDEIWHEYKKLYNDD